VEPYLFGNGRAQSLANALLQNLCKTTLLFDNKAETTNYVKVRIFVHLNLR